MWMNIMGRTVALAMFPPPGPYFESRDRPQYNGNHATRHRPVERKTKHRANGWKLYDYWNHSKTEDENWMWVVGTSMTYWLNYFKCVCIYIYISLLQHIRITSWYIFTYISGTRNWFMWICNVCGFSVCFRKLFGILFGFTAVSLWWF